MADENRSIGIKILRGFLYVLSRVVIVAAVLAVLVIAYQTAVNTMTVDMVIKDAFAKRAQYVLMPADDGSDLAAMEKLFTERAMREDEMLQSSRYRNDDYTITGYYERADVDNHLIWSWQNSATVEVTDIVRDITATSNIEPDATGRRPAPNVPDWQTGVYEVRVTKDSATGGWIIDGIKFEEAVIFEDPPTPAPTRTVPPAEEAAPAVVPAVEGAEQPAPAEGEGQDVVPQPAEPAQ